MISYVSTRGQSGERNFEDVLLLGLAPDGGLFVPQRWPQLETAAAPYNDIAELVMFPFAEGCIDRKTFRAMIDATYNEKIFLHPDVTPLKELYPGLFIMELFHGPTLAFKDIALQFVGRLFQHVLEKQDKRITIVGATSGDTGSAAIEGCRHSDRVKIFILHPHGRVTDVQRKQMTTVDAPNVHNIAIEGSFDDCQNLVKAMFNDKKFRAAHNLSAVNSINWARIAAQVVYYTYASLRLGSASFAVPTGNFGNVYAAWAARKMAAPVNDVCVATNRNDILTRFFETGEMKQEGSVPTYSPSMDIQISSNFERFLYDVLEGDTKKLTGIMDEFKNTGRFALDEKLMEKARGDFIAKRCSEEQTLATIKKVYDETGYLLEPHSAVGFFAAAQMKNETGGPVVAPVTAHPAKFADAVEKAVGFRPRLPEHLQGLMEKKEIVTVMPKDLAKVQEFIRQRA